MAKATGIGGVFLKSRHKGSELAAWYQKQLAPELEPWGGTIIKWPCDKAEDGGLTVWHKPDNDTKWFSPSDSPFMINYRVDDMAGMIEQLAAAGIEII